MYFPARLLSTAFLTSTTTSVLGSSAARRNATATSSSTSTTCLARRHMMSSPHKIGLGTYGLQRDQAAEAIHSAIAAGYRRIDCAPVYFNEDVIGDALHKEMSDGAIRREDLYVVSKLASPFHRKEHVRIGLQKTLTDLRLDYLDLYLIHWPPAFFYVDIDPTKRGYENEDIDDSGDGTKIDPSVSIHETWEAMEELVDEGLVREIGVSNFPVSLLHELLTRSKKPPVVNQVEGHPYLQQARLLKYCQARGVEYQAYSPLGTPGFKEVDEPTILDDQVLTKIAQTHNASVANVCIAWALQRGTSVVAKSASPSRQAENLKMETSPIVLSESEMEEIAKLDRGYRYFRPDEWWPEMPVAVFD